MYDGIALERQGVPAVVVCTELFEPTAKQMAEMQGVNDFPMVLIPHPLGRCPVDELEIKAEIAVDAIAALLLGDALRKEPVEQAVELVTHPQAVRAVLKDFAASLEADGFRLEVKEVSESAVKIVLTATDKACHDCLVSDELMIQMLEAAVRKVVPNATVVLEKKDFN